jgi:hypothetical protein
MGRKRKTSEEVSAARKHAASVRWNKIAREFSKDSDLAPHVKRVTAKLVARGDLDTDFDFDFGR